MISITSRRKCDSQKGNEERENERAKGEKEREEGRERARDRANEREREKECVHVINEAETLKTHFYCIYAIYFLNNGLFRNSGDLLISESVWIRIIKYLSI